MKSAAWAAGARAGWLAGWLARRPFRFLPLDLHVSLFSTIGGLTTQYHERFLQRVGDSDSFLSRSQSEVPSSSFRFEYCGATRFGLVSTTSDQSAGELEGVKDETSHWKRSF